MASFTYYLNPAQVSEQAKTNPQYETINPLGLTITKFHENRVSVEPTVPLSDRLIIIEQVAELRVLQPNVLRWEAVDAIPGQVAILPSALLAAALRHRPDRIIFGEIRDECANDLLQAMNTRPRRNAHHAAR